MDAEGHACYETTWHMVVKTKGFIVSCNIAKKDLTFQ